jgi:subtilisin-like proprotein convertase family protein
MKKFWTFACAIAIGVATTSASFADVSGSSLDAGTFDIGVPFTSTIVIGANEIISDVTLTINMEHSWIGDITATLTHVESGLSINLIPAALSDSSNLGVDAGGTDALVPGAYTFSDAGTQTLGTAAAGGTSSFEIPLGIYLASNGTATGSASLAALYGGDSTLGSWRIDFSDIAAGDDGRINGWSINFTSSAAIPEPGSMALLGLLGVACIARRRR